MNIIVVGLNHKTAPIELRECFAFSSSDVDDALASLKHHDVLKEVVILSTCNRVEVYAYGITEDAVKQWLCCRGDPSVALDNFSRHSYTLSGMEAVEHLMSVACGLDSLVLGEPEILGQVKSAFSKACLHKTVGTHLSRLFRKTFQVAKRVRTSTQIGACPVSVASTAVKFAKEWAIGGDPRILVIGSGAVGSLVAKYAQSITGRPLITMSRHLENARRLAQDVNGVAIELEKLTEQLSQVDIVISSTSSKAPIIHADMLTSITHNILLIDLAVPRDIAPDVEKHASVTLCQLDQLKETVQQHAHMRAHAAMQAKHFIEESAREFMLSLRTLESDEIIKRYRKSMELHCENEMKKMLQENEHEAETIVALKNFSRNLLNKIMHIPSVQLQQACIEGRREVLLSASEIFGIQGNTKQ